MQLLISKKSRRSREQAFVEYADVAMAQRAITWLDGIDYPALVKQLGCGGLVVRFADRKKPPPPT
jgi:RNA recognition motif. (a.k.a. RRM, RBD, or RNP domain)